MDAVVQLNSALQGRYDVEREIGAGGMATVYLARDIRHNRRVALKVLRPDLGAVLGVERFLSEIQVTANLQHPNLLPLFDSGEAGGLLFYVMPFVEGESLRVKLDREKQLPVDEAIRIAVSIANALSYAHERGVIHRDLKPENILLQAGEPVIADFGIALAVSNAGGGRVTQTGVSLGTPQYMSPEQATGDRVIDARTDIYSLGAMTYEMLVGDPPHVASTSQAIIAKVLTERPAGIRASRPSVAEHVEAAVLHALEKLPADRFATAREFSDALTGKTKLATTAGHATAFAFGPYGWRSTRGRLTLAAVVVAWLATLFATAMHFRQPPSDREIRFTIPTPGAALLWLALSPDGRLVTFVAPSPDGKTQMLWLRPVAATVAQPIQGTDGAILPFWSPDSRFIGFHSHRKLMMAPVAGGPPQSITDVPSFTGGTWNKNGVIVFSDGTAINRVAVTGGTPVSISALDTARRQSRHVWPQFLPDGRHFVFTVWSNTPQMRGIYVASLDGAAPSLLMAAESKSVFVRPGALLYLREQTLFARPFDAAHLRFTGEPVRVADDIVYNDANGNGAFAGSDSGVLVFRTGAVAGATRELQWFARDGKPLGAVGEPGRYGQMNLSPDRKRVAIDLLDAKTGRYQVWTLDLASPIPTRLTFDSAGAYDPIWMPDSRTVLFQSVRGSGHRNIYRKAIGSSDESSVLESGGAIGHDDVSSDGKYLLYHDARTPYGFVALPLTGDGKPLRFGVSQFRVDNGRFSPDGKWISYNSSESGNTEVHVAAFPAFDHQQRVSSRGGGQARWRADGKELFYLSPEGKVMSIGVTPGPVLQFAPPKELFPSPLTNANLANDDFGVSSDGQRFLLIAPHRTEVTTIDPITVVVNWMHALKK